MKKTTLIITLLLFVVTLSSCKKDGIYDPKGKIDKIYYEYNSRKYLAEDWTWEKDYLKTISYYDADGDLESTDYFTYRSDKRLLQVDNLIKNESMKYNYDNRHNLIKASHTVNGILSTLYEFEYDDNELSDIHITVYESADFNAKNTSNPLRYLLPETSLKSISKILKDSPSRGEQKIEIDLDWEGKNVTELELQMKNYSEEYIFEYDNKSNPFRGFLGLSFEESLFEHGIFTSKNNITKYIVTETSYDASETDVEIISYTYDGKLPVTRNHGGITEYFEYE